MYEYRIDLNINPIYIQVAVDVTGKSIGYTKSTLAEIQNTRPVQHITCKAQVIDYCNKYVHRSYDDQLALVCDSLSF